MWHLYDGYWNFNSHAHVERDPITSRLYWFARSISTHTLTWSVTYKMTPRDGVEVNFNSHAHVERDRIIKIIQIIDAISTHTLTWSVTNAEEIPVTAVKISTHTLTWSVTCFHSD